MALVVITGGARSGKSNAATRLAESRQRDGAAVTVAVFGRAADEEMRDRIARHRAERPAGFETLEVGTAAVAASSIEGPDWLSRVDDHSLLVIDCLGTMLGLVMEVAWAECGAGKLGEAAAVGLPDGYANRVDTAFSSLVSRIAARAGDTLVVTNEVGAGVVPEWASARLFRDLLGSANRSLVSRADAAYLAVAGRLMPLSEVSSQVAWPAE
ncbi:MAG TPA: bifunctional adenosylcobinamide kinase/adenosylcobinamide-phosphate guanylyltransferase [Coriobacteriia bacterium]|nr:bifunctional adenosylcobinamide kinase/adenosylcobinamide-phosphate guanylyltransferase [Coriobacteriia bacterium]